MRFRRASLQTFQRIFFSNACAELPQNAPITSTSATHFCKPRQSVEGGKFIQNRHLSLIPLLKITALRGHLTFGDPLLDSGVEAAQLSSGLDVCRCRANMALRQSRPVSGQGKSFHWGKKWKVLSLGEKIKVTHFGTMGSSARERTILPFLRPS